jgi:hypothetical protein
MFRKGYDTKGESDNRVIEVPAGKLGKDELRKRRDMFRELARQRRQEKKRGPIATTNPPKRSYPGKPTRLPRYDRMP